MNKKYKLTEETMEYCGYTLHRIVSLKDLPEIGIKKGQLGGWVGNEKNLSHEGLCWIFDDAKVYENGQVFGKAKVYENGQVFGKAKVYENGQVFGKAKVYENGVVFQNGRVFGNGQVFQNGRVFGNGQVFQNGRVYENGKVFGNGEWIIYSNSRYAKDLE